MSFRIIPGSRVADSFEAEADLDGSRRQNLVEIVVGDGNADLEKKFETFFLRKLRFFQKTRGAVGGNLPIKHL